MAFTSIGYDGTVTESQFAQMISSVGASEYGVRDAADWRVTAHPTQAQAVQIAPGSGWGPGVFDTTDAVETVQCNTIASGTRYDLIVARRDWQPPNGLTVFSKVTGGTARAIPSERVHLPGVTDEQPLALVKWEAGYTTPREIIDLRVWVGAGGATAADEAVKDYLTRPGTQLKIGRMTWARIVDAYGTGAASWTAVAEGPARHAEYTAPTQLYPSGSAIWGVGPDLARDASQSYNDSFISGTVRDGLTFAESGLYLFEFTLIGATAGPPDGEMLMRNVETQKWVCAGDMKRSVSWNPGLVGSAYIEAGQSMHFLTQNRYTAWDASARVKVTKLGA
jgi:hypothetical protein